MFMKVYSLIFFSIFFGVMSCFGQNSLTVVKVSSDTQPNYYSLKGERSVSKLTDGRFASQSPLWLDSSSVGWQQKKTITLDFELKELSSIEHIELSTAANEAANALNPLSVSVFFSSDGVKYEFLEDIADRAFDGRGSYRTYKLVSKSAPQIAKFIKIVVHPQGSFFFSDQVIIAGKPATKKDSKNGVLNKTEVLALAELNFHSQQRTALLYALARESKNKELLTKLNSYSSIDEATYTTFLKLFSNYSLNIEKPSSSGVSVTGNLSPWTLNLSDQSFNGKLNILHIHGTTSWVTLQVYNGDKTAVSSSLVVDLPVDYNLYEINKVVTRKSKFVFDPLIPVERDAKFTLSSNESKIFLLEISNAQKSKGNGSVSFSSGRKLMIDLDAKKIGIDEQFKKDLNLGVNVWSYYSYPFYKGREASIKKDLESHYVNVLPIAGWSIGDLVNIKEKELRDQLSYRKQGDKVLLFLNHRGILLNPGDYLKESWFNRFLSWYDKVYEVLESAGVESDNVYLYPYDEIRDDEIPYFNTFVNELKVKRPKTKFFMTIFRSSTISKIDVPVDIQQVVVTNNDLSALKIKGDFWIYDIMDDSKEVSAVSRFRALAWKAYFSSATGVGFWNYADLKGESLWNDNDGDRADYHAVYDIGAEVIPSLRWQAFKKGIEDYYILKKIESKVGASKLKASMAPLMQSKLLSNDSLDKLLHSYLIDF